MAFRDDQDAMLARAEALDREVKRLEKENAELRTEREREAAEAAEQRAAASRAAERARAQRAHLEELAAKTNAPKPPPPAPPANRASRPAADLAERLRRRSLRHAFTPIWLDIVLGAMIVVAWLAGFAAGAAVMFVTGLFFPPIMIPFLAASALGSVYLHIFVRDRYAIRTGRRLAALPLAIDVPGYLDRIANRFDETLVVSIELAELAGDDKSLLARAVSGAASATTSWNDDVLVVTSPRLKTCYRGSKGSSSYHNAQPHRWFLRLVERALLPIAASHHITTVRVR